MKYPFILLCLFFAAIISSCEVSHYIPPAISTPLFKDSGEKIIQVFAGSNHAEVQAACAFSRHIAGMVDIWAGFDGRYSVEVAPGLFKMNKNNICFEGFLGFGFASASVVDEVPRHDLLSGYTYTTKYVVTAPYRFVFFQPAIGYRQKNWEIAVSPRISYVKYGEFRYDRYEKDNNYQTKYILKEKVDKGQLDFWALQPTLMARVGFRKVKVFVSTSINMIDVRHQWEVAGTELIPSYQSALLAVGLHLRLGQKKETGEQLKKVK